jgi:hypothetical protein
MLQAFLALLIIVPLLAILAVLLRFMNRSMDQDRIRNYIEIRSGKILECKLQSASQDWQKQILERTYEVRYLDVQGHEHFAACVTGIFKGILWMDDKYLRYADQVEGTPMPGKTDVKANSLEAENQRLRDELERLKRKQPKKQ